MRANVSRVSSFYMQRKKGRLDILARSDEFAYLKSGRGYEYKAKMIVWKMVRNQRKTGKIPNFSRKILGNHPPDACTIRFS